jgi:hypothetical protein
MPDLFFKKIKPPLITAMSLFAGFLSVIILSPNISNKIWLIVISLGYSVFATAIVYIIAEKSLDRDGSENIFLNLSKIKYKNKVVAIGSVFHPMVKNWTADVYYSRKKICEIQCISIRKNKIYKLYQGKAVIAICNHKKEIKRELLKFINEKK